MLKDLRTQVDIVKALTIHELSGKMKTLNYGYVWLILEPIIYIAFIRLARIAFNPIAPPDNMPPLTFYTLGVIPTFLCFDVINKTFGVAGSSSGLLIFPRVTPVDLALATGFTSFCIYFTLFWVLLLPVSIFEGVWPPKDLFSLMATFIAIFVLSSALGFILSGAYRVFPLMTKFWSMIHRALKMVSGMFFVITMIPFPYWPYFTWNPLFHLSEMMRDAWFQSYHSPIASPLYVAKWTLVSLLLGLSVERFMRRIPYV